jgi:hypothetical protein
MQSKLSEKTPISVETTIGIQITIALRRKVYETQFENFRNATSDQEAAK